MRNPAISGEVRRRLTGMGLGRAYARRAATELHEHWIDLVEEAERQGIGRREAEERAAAALGNARDLAEALFERMRHTSWLARNPAAAFTVLPLMITMLWWAALLALTGLVSGYYSWNPNVPGSAPPERDLVIACVDLARWTSYLAAPLACCYIAREYFCGWKPALWSCLIAAIHNAAHSFEISGEPGSGTVSWAYSFATRGPDVFTLLPPLLVFAIFWLWNAHDEKDGSHGGPKLC